MERYDPWRERLSEFLDGGLEPADRAALEAHLEDCVDCGATLADLRAVVALAAGLEDSAPRRDLWPGIRDRIRADSVHPLRAEPGGGRLRPSRRFSFSLPQLAAACIAVALLGGGAVWLLAPGSNHLGPTGARPLATASAQGPAITAAGPVIPRLASDIAGQQYDAAVADLERTLAAGRGQLAPATIAILEENLAIIDRAIEEARRAISEDPANLYLTNYLADTMKRKLELLRYTNSIVRAQS